MLLSAMVFTAGCALFAAPEAALPPPLLKHEPFVQYLKASGETVPEADAKRAALTGHSRNGKSSLMGSALDERFAAVISSSSGVGGCMPSRLCGEHQFAEGIENITRSFMDWFHPRRRQCAGPVCCGRAGHL